MFSVHVISDELQWVVQCKGFSCPKFAITCTEVMKYDDIYHLGSDAV